LHCWGPAPWVHTPQGKRRQSLRTRNQLSERPAPSRTTEGDHVGLSCAGSATASFLTTDSRPKAPDARSPPSVPKGGVTTLVINLLHSPKTGQCCPAPIRARRGEQRPHSAGAARMGSPPAAPQTHPASEAAEPRARLRPGRAAAAAANPALWYRCPAQDFVPSTSAISLAYEGSKEGRGQ